MKKIINVAPVNEIDLVFNNGESLTLKFDVEALYRFYDAGNGLNDLVNETSIPRMCAKVIYIGATGSDPDFTLEKATALVADMSPATITEIINEFNESMGSTKNEVQQELSKKLMAEFASKKMK